jgi:hypothetical protein
VTKKREPEPVMVLPEKEPLDPCFCCFYKRIDEKCEHEDSCELLEADLNKEPEKK